MKAVNILAFGAHPDDVEIFMGGSLLFFKSVGLSIGICDLTQGEAGTYGDRELRKREKNIASKMLDLNLRETLDIPDGQVRLNDTNLNKIINVLRAHCPKVVFTMPPGDRHPDHYNTHYLVKEACFLSGLKKWKNPLPAHRPGGLAYYPELTIDKKPDFVVDISAFINQKIAAIKAYGSQVVQETEKDQPPLTLIRSNLFWKQLNARTVQAGSYIGVEYGEPFYSFQSIQVTDPLNQIYKRGLH